MSFSASLCFSETNDEAEPEARRAFVLVFRRMRARRVGSNHTILCLNFAYYSIPYHTVQRYVSILRSTVLNRKSRERDRRWHPFVNTLRSDVSLLVKKDTSKKVSVLVLVVFLWNDGPSVRVV